LTTGYLQMFKVTLLLAIAASASGFQLGSSFTPRLGATQARAGRSVGPTMAAVPCGINGFGRIGRLVARIMIKVFRNEIFHSIHDGYNPRLSC
jgi:lactate dehydrogenase-like 2-hydroxyacid dehydrogenase